MPPTHICVQLGGKGANLAEMASIGLSVPPGFTVSTEACRQYQLQELGGGRRRAMPAGLWDEVVAALRLLERAMDSGLGDPRRPLLLSVRSGAAVSMPGMMDTVLNLGLNDQVVAGLAQRCGCRFAYDSYRRFLDMFGNVVTTPTYSTLHQIHVTAQFVFHVFFFFFFLKKSPSRIYLGFEVASTV